MLQRIGWVSIAVGILLAISFVSGLTHPVSAQVPSTMASYGSHHRWVVVGFAVSMAGALLLIATETIRRSRKPQVDSGQRAGSIARPSRVRSDSWPSGDVRH